MMRGFRLAVLALALALTAVSIAWQPWVAGAQGSPISPDVMQAAVERTVLVTPLIPDGNQPGAYKGAGFQCSGAVVAPSGLVLTSGRCVRAATDQPRVGVRKGQLFNPEGLVLISVQRGRSPQPEPFLEAKSIGDDPSLDLALLKPDQLLTGDEDQIPASFRMASFALGDAERVQPGDPVAIIGHTPDGRRVQTNQTAVAQFITDRGRRVSITVTAFQQQAALRITFGGPVINARGELVAIFQREQADRSVRATLISRIPAPWLALLGGPGPQAVQTAPPQTQVPPAPAPAMVVVRGRVVAAAGGEPVAGAKVYILQQGEDPRRAQKPALSYGETDASGSFETRPPVRWGARYPLLVVATGYRPFIATLALEGQYAQAVSIGVLKLERP